MKVERNRGSWHGKVALKLPVGHSTFMTADGLRYVDPGQVKPFHPRWRRWASDVAEIGIMIIQKDKLGPELDSNGFPMCHSVGYLGVYLVDNVKFDDENGFSCDLVRRLDD